MDKLALQNGEIKKGWDLEDGYVCVCVNNIKKTYGDLMTK